MNLKQTLRLAQEQADKGNYATAFGMLERVTCATLQNAQINRA